MKEHTGGHLVLLLHKAGPTSEQPQVAQCHSQSGATEPRENLGVTQSVTAGRAGHREIEHSLPLGEHAKGNLVEDLCANFPT